MNSSTRMAWPVNLEQQPDGSVLVSFPDIPQALTEGATIADALSEAEDCLIAALGGYINDLRDVPQPSAARGRPVVALSTLAASKIALYCAMRAQGLGNTALAQRLGTAEGTVRRLPQFGPPFAHWPARSGSQVTRDKTDHHHAGGIVPTTSLRGAHCQRPGGGSVCSN